MLIGWQVDEARRIRDVVVCDQQRVQAGMQPDAALWLNQRFAGTSGACIYGWAGNLDNTMMVWAGLAIEGFVSADEARKAVRQFAKIDHKDWARLMVQSWD